MIKIPFYSSLTALTIFLMSGAVLAKDQAPEQSADGLELIEKYLHGELLANPNVDWSRFTSIQLEKAPVEFGKHWVRNQRHRTGSRPREKDMESIKTDLSELLDEVFRQELTANDTFTMTDAPGENVMRITPKITDLNILAPDRMRDYIGYSLADSKGSMTLELEIYDSVNGTLLARMEDNREDPQNGYMEWATRGTNRQAARFMFIRWAVRIRERLIEAEATDQD